MQRVFTLDPGALPPGYGEELIPLEDAKAHLRVDGDDEDALIGYYRDAAVQLVEQMSDTYLGPRDGCEARGVEIRPDGSVRLGMKPIRSLVSVTGYSGAGETVAVEVSGLVVRRDIIFLAPGATWPLAPGSLVDVVFDAGPEDALTARATYPSLFNAALMMIAYLYENRGGGGPDGEVPPGIGRAVQFDRRVRI